MRAIIEVSDYISTQGSEPQPGPPITGMRQFTLAQIGSRLSAEADLVAAFWDEIGAPVNPACPDLTVLYCSLRWLGQPCTLLEFVAGETLEELVKRSNPAFCELEIPLFCRLLDAFEGTPRDRSGPSESQPDMELIDFGIGRAMASTKTRLHGAILVGPDGAWTEQIFGEIGAGRREVCALLMELCARLPGSQQLSRAHGPASLGEYAVSSLASKAVTTKPVPRSLLARTVASPYVVAVATAALTLFALQGLGALLAKRSPTPNTGRLLIQAAEVLPDIEAPPSKLTRNVVERPIRLP